jgi:PTH1 family peptidyl-tRNA hydrolase
VAGLGNPGERYRRTRHNVGYLVVDELAARAGAGRFREEADAWVAAVRVAGEDVLLAKPFTFMNRSGSSVERLLAAYGQGPPDVLAVVDDVALELGQLRIRERGSHGGHNGLRSLIESLGSEEFPRVRVGIRKGDPPAELADFVLADFPQDDVLVVQEMVGWAADAIESAVADGVPAAMNRFNGQRKA